MDRGPARAGIPGRFSGRREKEGDVSISWIPTGACRTPGRPTSLLRATLPLSPHQLFYTVLSLRPLIQYFLLQAPSQRITLLSILLRKLALYFAEKTETLGREAQRSPNTRFPISLSLCRTLGQVPGPRPTAPQRSRSQSLLSTQ